MNWEDQFVIGAGRTKGHEYKLKGTKCLNSVKKFIFTNKRNGNSNGPETKAVWASSIHGFKGRLHKSIYKDRKTQA